MARATKTENSAIMHLARKQGMDIVAQTGEADAWLTLPPADTTSYMSEAHMPSL